MIAKYRPRLEGKTVMLFVGGLRPRHVIGAYEDLGMEVVGTGYEFGHNDDYQRTTHYVKDGTLIYDDVTGFEFEKFVEKVQPDLVGSGIKGSTCSRRWACRSGRCTPGTTRSVSRLDGFGIFARDMDMAINSPVWGLTNLVLVTERLASHADLERDMPRAGAHAALEFIDARCPWREDVTLTGEVQVQAIQRIVEWLA